MYIRTAQVKMAREQDVRRMAKYIGLEDALTAPWHAILRFLEFNEVICRWM